MTKRQSTKHGVIETWKGDEGYGFIQPDGGGKDYFFHKSAISNQNQPAPGQTVTFTVGRDDKGRLRAENVTIKGRVAKVTEPQKPAFGLPELGGRGPASIGSTRLFLFAIPFAATAFAAEWGLLAIYTISSLIGFGAITLDKRFAQQKMWRIPEASLHLIELVGGWPGSGAAQQMVRHKTQKLSYQLTFWLIAALHIALGIDYLFLGFSLMRLITA